VAAYAVCTVGGANLSFRSHVLMAYRSCSCPPPQRVARGRGAAFVELPRHPARRCRSKVVCQQLPLPVEREREQRPYAHNSEALYFGSSRRWR